MEQLKRVYEAFNARDLETALSLMHDDVDWPNGWEGGRVRGHAEVRDYWTRQFAAIDATVEPVGFSEDSEGRIAVEVQQTVKDLDGNVASDGRITHLYTLRDGLVTRMDIVSPA